jgi:hypothetical protein
MMPYLITLGCLAACALAAALPVALSFFRRESKYGDPYLDYLAAKKPHREAYDREIERILDEDSRLGTSHNAEWEKVVRGSIMKGPCPYNRSVRENRNNFEPRPALKWPNAFPGAQYEHMNATDNGPSNPGRGDH